MEQEAKQLITKETLIGDIVEKHPEVVDTLTSFGVHCVGCHVSPFESLEMGFKGHGMDDATIEEAVKKLNEVAGQNGAKAAKKVEFDVSKAKLNLTDKAAGKLKELMEQEKKKGLRISVLPGGCSGFQYGMELDDEPQKEDMVFEEKGVKIFVDKASMAKLDGANVDFVDALQGAGFKIDNPNAESTCGCGSSFG